MWKAGLIGAGVGFVLALGGALLMPILCNPCAALFVGLGAGFLACVFVKPMSNASAAEGAKAGAIATVGNLLGQMVGAVINTFLVGPEGAFDFARELGLPVSGDPASMEIGYYVGTLGGGCLCGLLGVGIGAGLGAVGGLLWYQVMGKNQSSAAEPFEFEDTL